MNGLTGPARVTVLGAGGFIGAALVAWLRRHGVVCLSPGRDEALPEKHLGTVVYCIGLTADFRSRPYDTVEAHVCKLERVLRDASYDGLVYLSSTRVYKRVKDIATEETPVELQVLESDDLYDASKVMGESLVLSAARNGRVARLSNVYGADFRSENFLSEIVRAAVEEGRILLRTSLDSAKDYVSLEDVCWLLWRIASGGRERLYNVASGRNVSHRQLVERLRELTGCSVEVADGAPLSLFPEIETRRVKEEFGFVPREVLEDLRGLLESYRAENKRGT